MMLRGPGNAPTHRAFTQAAQMRIRAAVQRRGALLFWNPPHSPDLNPIEHLWNTAKLLSVRRLVDHLTLFSWSQRAFASG